MASTYSNLKIQLMATGENNSTWGTVTNTNLGTALEEAITGSVDVTFASGDVTLTLTNTNATQSARNLRLNCTGTTGGARNLILGSGCQIEKVYIVNNGCADAITIKNTTGTGIAVPAGKTMYVFNNGTNVVDAITHLTSLTLGSPLAIADGGTGTNLTTFANLQSNVSGILPIANGGTGSSTATFSGANITSLNASSVSSGTLALARGGTGANDASGARSNLGLGSLATLSSVGTSQIDNSAVTPGKLSQPFTTGTASATTSGTSVDITGIPSWVRRITVILNGVSNSGGSDLRIQIGDSGGIETTDYTAVVSWFVFDTNLQSTGNTTSAWQVTLSNGSSYATSGILTLCNVSGNTWVGSGNFNIQNVATTNISGVKTLSATLDRIRLTTVNGTDTFDAGSINIMYE